MRYPALKYFLARTVLLLLILFSARLPLFAQQVSWLQTGHSVQGNGGNAEIELLDMKADSKGNLILAGCYFHEYSKTWQNDYSIFAGAILKSQKLNKGAKFGSGFIAKTDPAGRLIWIKNVEGQSFPDGFMSYILDLELDEKDNIYFSGTANANLNLTFGGIPFPKYAKSKTPDFIGKADSAGNVLSLTRFWDGSAAWNNDIYNIVRFKVDKAGNYYIRGHLRKDYGISCDSFTKPASGNFEYNYIAKFTSQGKLLAINFIDSLRYYYTSGSHIFELDRDGNIYTNRLESSDQYLAQYNSADLSLKNQIRIGNTLQSLRPQTIFPADVVADNQGNIYFSGYFTDTLIIGVNAAIVKPGNNGFIAKLNQDLQVLWIKLSSQNSGGGFLHIGPKNKIYTLGTFNGSAMSFGSRSLTFPDSANRYFIAGFDTTGECLSLIGFSEFDNVKFSGLTGTPPFFHVDQCDNLFLAGYVLKEFKFGSLRMDFTNYLYQRGCFVTKFTWDSIHYNPVSTCGKIRLQNQSAIPGAKYYWMSGNTVLDTTYHLEYAFPKSGKYPITLVSDKIDGCHSVYTDTINYTRMVTGFATQQEQGCQWVGYRFTNTSLKDSGIKYTWHWDFGDGVTDTTQSPMHVFTQSGKYTVKLVSNNGSCTDTFIQVQAVNILPAPKPRFKVNDSVACVPFTVTVTPETQDNNLKYKYSFGDGHEDISMAPTYTYTTPGNYWLKQELKGTTGCVTKDSVEIIVRQGVTDKDVPEAIFTNFATGTANADEQQYIGLYWKSLKNRGVKKYLIYRHYADGSMKLWREFTPGHNPSAQYEECNTEQVNTPFAGIAPFGHSIVAEDSCGNRSAHSKVLTPIFLRGENIENKAFILRWTPYEGAGIKQYKAVLRQPQEEIGTTADTTLTSDQFLNLYNEQQCYLIDGYFQVPGYSELTTSNKICIPYLPTVFIPNAFSPNKDGINDTFKVVSLGMSEFSLSIYDRWGQRIFSSDSVTSAWDGTKDGRPLPTGVYVFTLSGRTNKGERIYKTGNITLMR